MGQKASTESAGKGALQPHRSITQWDFDLSTWFLFQLVDLL